MAAMHTSHPADSAVLTQQGLLHTAAAQQTHVSDCFDLGVSDLALSQRGTEAEASFLDA